MPDRVSKSAQAAAIRRASGRAHSAGSVYADNVNQADILKERIGLDVKAEQRAIIKLSDEFGMFADDNISCNLNSGEYHKIVDTLSELLSEGKLSQKQAARSKILDYFTKITHTRNTEDKDFSYYYSQFFRGSNWQENRDAAYVALAALVKETQSMRDFVADKLANSTDAKDKARIRYANEFVAKVQLVFDAMEATGGISEEAKLRAAEAKANFFPALLANPFPEKNADASTQTSYADAVKQSRGQSSGSSEQTTKALTYKDQAPSIIALWSQLSTVYKLGDQTKHHQTLQTGVDEVTKLLEGLDNKIVRSTKPLRRLETALHELHEALEPMRQKKDVMAGKDRHTAHAVLEYIDHVMDLIAETLETVRSQQSSLQK